MHHNTTEKTGGRFGLLVTRSLAGLSRRFKWIGQLLRSPFVAIGTLIVLAFLLLAIFGERVAPYDYDEDAFSNYDLAPYEEPDCFAEDPLSVPVLGNIQIFDPINAECNYVFGTDDLGRDVFSRVILGTREIFRLAGLGTLIAVIIGAAIGLVIGYQGGWLDEITSRFLDSLLSIPALLLALILIGSLPASVTLPFPDIAVDVGPINFELGEYDFSLLDNSLVVVLVIVYSPIVARVVRSNVLSIKTREFVEAAQLRGESQFYILTREILPSVIPALVVEASLRFSYGIFLVASLGFLSLGTDPPTPNWGLMVNEAYVKQDYVCNEFQCRAWTITYPAMAIVLLVVSVNLMSDGIKQLVQRND
ncbi:MAG: ABC transporter permease [Chloroflexi bacterium]|nr:ABC transporter permease [Chloroflexota bacterium]